MAKSLFVKSILLVLVVASGTTVIAALASDGSTTAFKDVFRRPTDIPFPADNLYTPEKSALGKALFFDPRLSGNQNMTCATCHNPSFGWEVSVKTPIGAQNTALARQAPTVLNQAWVHPQFWDGRANSLEEQAKGPIQAPAEMNLPLDEAVKRISAVADYRSWFKRVFPDTGVSADTIAMAIATYERTVVASYAPFDTWLDGDEAAIPEAAKRGFALFNGKAQCASCHSGWNFTDNKFHDIGTSQTDIGRGKLEPDNIKAQFAFKTPSLRDIGQRAPYMHDGSLATLEDVLQHYLTGGVKRPSQSDKVQVIDLTPAEVSDVIAFLRTLTGSRQVVALPVLPN
jgi:cytochrome c peroxidase